MEILKILIVMVIICILVIVMLVVHILKEKKQLQHILTILTDIQNGNLDRRILAHEKDATADICYKINEIVLSCKNQLIQARVAEKANKQLLTSLSHDIKTPLTSLVGYLEAVKSGVVDGEEKDSYIEVASNKAYELKDYVDMLFEWVKLSSNERTYHFEQTDINELTRHILVGLIPQLEVNHFSYDIQISHMEFLVPIDISAYTRIINNLIQNAIEHSGGNKIILTITMEKSNVIVTVSDNGKGISETSLPYIFDRLYKSDVARSKKGSGLGLYIVKELVTAHNGVIQVTSIPNIKTDFIVTLPK